MKKTDEKFMKRALELALKGQGRTSPNPVVGAVVVKKSRIIGEGYHKCAGNAHAEIVALRKAGLKAKGADLYITLEPCCHYGRTPPCSDAIIKFGVKRVIVGTRDPNPLVNGKGIKALKTHGIKVECGVLEDDCRRINWPYLKWVVSGIPYVTLKVALSLDGKIATSAGESKWITNKPCRNYVHQLRKKSDAILVGINTVLKDNPRLTARLSPSPLVGEGVKPRWGHAPLRGRGEGDKTAIILDSRLRLPKTSKLYERGPKTLIIATTSQAPKSKIKEFERRGHKILMCRSTSDGRVFLPHLLGQLAAFGITSILVEGGAEIYSDFMQRGLVDKIVACVAPKIIGGNGKEWLSGIAIKNLKSAIQLHDVSVRFFLDNLAIEGLIKD